MRMGPFRHLFAIGRRQLTNLACGTVVLVATTHLYAAPQESSDEATPATVANDAAAQEEPEEQVAELTIGDEAPALKIAEWVHGEKVEGFKKDHIYVVEFWATWCGPCLASMPHVSKLQEEYQDRATFVGISREEVDTVKEFLEKEQEEEETWADVLTYNLGMDEESATNNAYMRAAGQNGIPCAFVVGRDQRIEWIGHPMNLDDVLAKVDANEWDRAAFKKQYDEQKEMEKVLQAASLALRRASQTGEWGPAIEALEKAMEKAPDHPGLQMAFMSALVGAERFDEVGAAIKRLREKNWEDAGFLNALAWEMVTRVPEEHRDLEAAQEIAIHANDLTEGKNPSVLDTLARVKFERGELEAAVELQKQAVELAPQMRQLKTALREYEKALAGPEESEESDESEEQDQDEK